MKIFKICIFIMIPILSLFLFIALYRMSLGKEPFVSMTQFISYAKTLNIWSPYSNFINDLNEIPDLFGNVYNSINGAIEGSMSMFDAIRTSITSVFGGIFKTLTLPFALIYDFVKLLGGVFSIFYEFLIFCNM